MTIIRAPDARLKQVCPAFNFASPIRNPAGLANALRQDMAAASGLGLAAPQIGVLTRAFVLRLLDGIPVDCFNPEVVEHGSNAVMADEGCLSFPGLFPKVRRWATVTAAWYDVSGTRHERRFRDRDARAFQHELDHLDGVLIEDRVSAMAMQMARANAKKKGRI